MRASVLSSERPTPISVSRPTASVVPSPIRLPKPCAAPRSGRLARPADAVAGEPAVVLEREPDRVEVEVVVRHGLCLPAQAVRSPARHRLPGATAVHRCRAARVVCAAVTVIDTLLANNEAFVASLPAAHLDVRPRRRLAIVTCMDSRLDVFAALGLTRAMRTSCATRAASSPTT